MTDSAHISWQSESHSLQVTGDLNFATVVSLWAESLNIIQDLPVLTFDLTGVKTCNSAGLALLIEWIKYAKHHAKTISFTNIPKNLLAIIKLADVDHLVQAH